ncbi:ankyrin-2-like isoform X2 [Zerene cesonia]|uniref:ankyrin-2-like isoform X2 n=1 Tax=Zerene cesonia TaxID=33412 RepID=UPI0018E592C0|nr:ankyrin-2-like isoform X2 [Zerene cesonia]
MTTETATPNQADASTAFLRAARAGQIDKIISLLEQGVDINVSNANGLNAIHLASKDGHVEVVRELLQRGAAIDAATKKGNTALHIASLAGQEAVVRLLVQNGAQVNIQSQNGFTPLYMAAQENHDGVVKFLLANGANQSLATEDGFTPLAVAMQQGHEKVVAVLLEADTRGRVRLPALHIAAKKDDVKAANLLLENEHNPDVTSKSGFTPLHIAAHYGNEAVARLLLAKGADVNCAAKHNICPLHVAAKWGKDNMVSLLCDNGANVEARTRDGLTPLHCAARSGHDRVVEALLDRGAPITSKSKNGLAPLHMAAQGDHSDAARVLLARRAPVDDVTVDYLTALHVAAHCGHAKVAKLLLDRNADANARALNGFTPLHIACKKNRIKVVELLLKYGASIQATTESGLTPLHVASFMGCMNIVIYLLQHEANPDVPTVRGETPLHLAARANQTDIIRILLRNGAAVEAKARERQTPLHIASRLGNVDIAVLLLQHGADVRANTTDHYNALHIAAKQHNHDVAAALIEHNAPLTATTKKGFTALHIAAKYGNLKVANLLLANGASPDQAGKNGMTPLHVAAQYDQQAVANTLLEKGADAKAIAKNGHTPLHIASRKNQMETAATLLEYGALTNAESKAGFTPLHLAAQQGHAEMCSLLLEQGAEVDHQAKNGLAALHLAAQEDRVPVAQLLVKNGAQVDICTKGGYTPLHIASHYGQANMVRYLLENGASIKAQTSHGYTALHHAAQQGHINIVNILLEHKADANATTVNGQTPLDIASKLGYVTVMETLKEVSEPSLAPASQDKYKVVAPETMLETFMSDSEEEGGEDTILNDQPYRYLTADDMKSLGDDSLPIDVTKDERTESAMSHKNIMEISQGSVNGLGFQPQSEVVVKSISRYSTAHAPEGYCYNVDPTLPKKKLQWKNFLVSFLVDARGGALRGCRGGGVRVIVPPLSAQQPTRITCRYLKPSRINHMPPLMEGEALAARVLEMGPVSAKFLGPVILEVPHYASLRGKEREIVILRSDNGSSWREHNADATDDVVQDILNETLEIEDTSEEERSWEAARVTRILTHDFPQYFAVISRIRQEVHAIGPEGGMVSSSVVPQVQAVFPQGALTKKIKVGLQAQIIDSELTAKLLGRGVAVSPVVTVEPRRRKFHKAITLSMPAPRPHTQGMTNQYSTSSAPTLRLLCSISGVFRKRSLEGGTNRAHWEDVTENTPLTFVNDCVSFTTTVSARYWLIDCRHIEDATKMATELYREAIHVPFMARFVVYAKRTDECQAQLRMFCVTDDNEDKTLERIERFIQVAKSRDVEVHEGKPIYLEFGGNLVPVAKSGEQLSIPFRAFRENRVAFPVMIKTQDLEPICRCQFMRDPKVPKGEPSPTPIAVLNIMVPDDVPAERISPVQSDTLPRRTEEQELIWRQRLSDPRLEDICTLLGKDWVALAYELGVSVATVNQIQAKRITAAEQAQLMLKLWKTQSGTKAQDNSLELALCRIGRDDIIAPQSEGTNERRILRNIYQERQASEEIEAYKAEEDNKLKETIDDSQISERMRTEDLDQDEAKYSPEEKSVIDKSEVERTPTPSEESEEDEDVKRSVAERKQQITKKLSSSKIPASKQKKEIREEIIEIKTQIKPDIKKFQDIEQQVKEKEPKLERTRSKTSPETTEIEESEVVKEVREEKKEETKEHKVEQFRKFDPSSPAKPTPKHLQRHMRNDSMRFPSGDFSNIVITPKKSLTSETIETKSMETKDTYSKDIISQKEIDSARVAEKLEDGEKSPELVMEEKDVAEATLKDKISVFETKISKEPQIDTTKTIKLTREALKKHTMEHDQAVEYTQEFVREQAKQMESQQEIETQEIHKVSIESTKHTEVVKSVKETIQQFDSKIKFEDKSKSFTKSARTDSTIVQVSSEEDSEFLKKSTDSETETESQTTIKAEKDKLRKIDLGKQIFDKKSELKNGLDKKDDHDKRDDDDRKGAGAISFRGKTLEKQLTDELRSKVSDEEITETFEEKDVSIDDRSKEKIETQSITSAKSEISKTKTDSPGSEIQSKLTQESPLPSAAEKGDSLADLQQSTERDISFVSQTESKVYSKHRSDSLDESSQFSDLEDQIGMSPAHKPTLDKQVEEPEDEISIMKLESSKTQTQEFLQYETEYTSRSHISTVSQKEPEKVPPKESPVISAKARQFIETVPEDDSVQECFFSKRIYSDSLEDSEHTDSRRHSEAESLKSDQSDMKAKVSSSDFDERAEYEETADSGSGFGDEKFEESVGFTSMRIDPKTIDSDKQSTETSEEKEADVIFKKVTPKRHSRTESVSISKLSDLIPDSESKKSKQEFQMFVTEAEEIDRSFEKDEASDKISSESSREIEISDRKSSEGISDRISSEDAVTDKKTSSEEEGQKICDHAPDVTEATKSVKEMINDFDKTDISIDKDAKRQSIVSAESGSVGELRLEEKRPSDARSLTESRDYTFEESEDDIRTQGTHVDIAKDKVDVKEVESKKSLGKSDASKIAKLTHGDSLDDVEAFPEDHVADYVHKLPHIAEISSDKLITDKFLSNEREQQSIRETIQIITKPSKSTSLDTSSEIKPDTQTKEPTRKGIIEEKDSQVTVTSMSFKEDVGVTKEPTKKSTDADETLSVDVETKTGTSGEIITITTKTELTKLATGEDKLTKTITENTKYPSGKETTSTSVSETIKSVITERETNLSEAAKHVGESLYDKQDKSTSTKTEIRYGPDGEEIITTTVTEVATTADGDEMTRITVTEKTKYASGRETVSTNVSESIKSYRHEKIVSKDDKKDETEHDTDKLKLDKQLTIDDESCTTDVETKTGVAGELITITTKTNNIKTPSGDEIVRTTITEVTKYPSGKETTSTKVFESIKSHKETVISSARSEQLMSADEKCEIKETEPGKEEDKSTSTRIDTKVGDAGEEITIATVTEILKTPSGEEIEKITTTETIKYPDGKQSISTKVSERMRSSVSREITVSSKSRKIVDENDLKNYHTVDELISIPDSSKKEMKSDPVHEKIKTHQPLTSESKFDITKIRTDTLSKLEIAEVMGDTKKSIPKDLPITDTQEITKEQIKPVIDDILQKGSIVAATRSPTVEKEFKSKETMETEKRTYDAKVPHKEERRHSCISPAISLERIAESEIEGEEDIIKPKRTIKFVESETKSELKKSDSAMKQMADNIEIIIKQASEEVDISSEEPVHDKEVEKEITEDDKIYETEIRKTKEKEIDEIKKEFAVEESKIQKERPALMKSLSRDSGEIIILPKKKHTRTFSVQSSPDEIEEQIYTDSESDMDKAKVLEIIEPTSDAEGKMIATSFDTKRIRTDSLDDADDFPEKEVDFFEEDKLVTHDVTSDEVSTERQSRSSSTLQKDQVFDKTSQKFGKKTHYVDSILRSDLISKSTTESSVTTVVSTLTKSSDEDQRSVIEEGTSADFSKLSGADLMKDSSKTSADHKDEYKAEEQFEDRATPDLSKKSLDLTKDYSKSSIDSKDTSRDFATNELSKDSTVDLTKDFSKVSIDSVKETSRSIDEKTFSEDHSSMDVSKTLASDASDGITLSKEFIEEERSTSKIVQIASSSSHETSIMTESKLLSEYEEKVQDKSRLVDSIEQSADLNSEKKYESKQAAAEDIKEGETVAKPDEEESEIRDMKELNRRCSNLLEDISSQGALIRIDSSHITHDLASKLSKTPPPSPVDLTMRDKARAGESVVDKQSGLQLTGSDTVYLDASRQSPRASSGGDSQISETDAHQSDILTESSKVLSAAAIPTSPSKHLADNLAFVNVDKPTITSGAMELVDRTIEKSIDVIDQIKKEQLAVKMEEMQRSTSSDTFYSESRVETSTSSSSIHKTVEGSQLKFQSIDPDAVMSDMIAKFGTTSEFSTVVSHKETETKKISGQEFFSETKQVSSSDDDSLVIKTQTSHELRGQEHEIKEKTVIRKDGEQTETSQKKMERAHVASAKRSDVETKTVFKSTDDTDIVKVEREFSEQGLYTGRQTKSEERMTALKDETVKKKSEVKISERDLSHEQWGKEYFTQPGELEDIHEVEDTKTKVAFVDSTLKIVEKDEVVSSFEVSEKGKIISSKVEHHKEESVIESKEHDDLSSEASHAPSFKSESGERRGSTESSPKSKSKSFKKDDEIYEVDFIKEIKVSTSPIKSTFSRTGSQDTHSESEVAPELPHDADTPKKEKITKSPVKIPQQQLEDQVLELSIQQKTESPLKSSIIEATATKSSDGDTILEIKPVCDLKTDITTKPTKTDISPGPIEISEEMSSSKDIMIKSADSVDTECMIKSLESHEAEILQKSMDSTVSAETLHPSEFSTEADSAFLTGTDHKKEEMRLIKEKSLEDICSSGYDTDLSSAEFHAAKQEMEKVDLDSVTVPPLTDLSVLEKTIDEVKQSIEAAQVEIISEKSDGSIKYKQSPSEFQFKILISPDRPEVITEEPQSVDDATKSALIQEKDEKSQISDSTSHKISSQEETTISDTDNKETVQIKESSPPLDADISIKSDSGPHSILETESDIISDRDLSSKGSPEVKLRVQKHIKSKLGVADRRSASEIEGWSSSGESHYHSFEHSESRPLSSDVEVMMTAQSATEFETALTSHDVSSQSLRTSKDYYTACSSLASRDSMRSLDSDGSSHVASIDISDASETLVPSAHELKEELMESSTYVEQFLHESEKDLTKKTSDEEVSGEEEDYKSDTVEPVGKMKRSHEMRFQPKDMIPEHFPLETTSESTEFDEDSLKDKEGSDTTISSQLKTDEILSSSISKLDMSSSQSQLDLDKEEVQESISKVSSHSEQAIPFSVTKIERTERQFVDIESEIIPVGSAAYQEIEQFGSIVTESTTKSSKEETAIEKTTIPEETSIPKVKSDVIQSVEIKEQCIKKTVQDISVVPFPVTEKPPSQREFVDVEEEIIPVGSKQYEEILKSKSDSSVPKTSAEKATVISEESKALESKQSSASSLKTHEYISTPHTPLSAPSQSSLSTDNGREYILDDIYDISETPELKSDLITESSKSELLVTTDERTLRNYEKEQDSPTSDEFEMVDKPSEMDDFVVIEEVAKEAQESDPEGKSLQIKSYKYVARHDTEVEEYLSKTSKKQESASSTSGSSDDDMQYEMEQRRLQAQELAEIEAGKRWIQMQFEGDPRYDYERIPLEDIKEEEMTDFDASRIGSLSSQKESIGSYGSFRNSYGSLSESEMASRMRFRIKGENDDISISSLQEFENLERALMEQYQQNSSSSQDSLNGSLPRRYILSKSQGEEIEISSLKEFEGLESACLEALKAELLAKQKEALLLADPKVVSGSFLEQEKRSYDSSSDSSPPMKSGSPGQKSGSPSQKSGSPSQKGGGSPSQRVGSYGSPSQKLLADSAAIRKLIDQQLALEQRMQEARPKIVTVKKYDDKGAFFVPVPEPESSEPKSSEVVEECTKSSSFVCASAPSDGSAESIPGDCEEMMKILDQEEKSKDKSKVTKLPEGGVIEVVRTTTVIQQRFVDGKKVSEKVTGPEGEGAVDIPARAVQYDESRMSLGSEMSSSLASQPSEMDSLMTVVERQTTEGEIITYSRQTISVSADRPDDLDFSREGSAIRELSPSSGRSIAHSIVSGKQFTDPASGSWSAQDEELSSSGSFSRARADLMLGSTDSLEATSSNATRATYNYEVDTPMTGSLTSGGSNTMVSSLDTLDPVTAVQMESLEHQSTSDHYSQFEVHEPDSDTERLELDGRVPKTKERTIMFDSTDTLSAVSGDNSVKEATIEAPAATFYIGDTPIVRGDRHEDENQPTTLSGSCPASLPPTTQASPPIPAQRRSLTMLAKSPHSSLEDTVKK